MDFKSYKFFYHVPRTSLDHLLCKWFLALWKAKCMIVTSNIFNVFSYWLGFLEVKGTIWVWHWPLLSCKRQARKQLIAFDWQYKFCGWEVVIRVFWSWIDSGSYNMKLLGGGNLICINLWRQLKTKNTK